MIAGFLKSFRVTNQGEGSSPDTHNRFQRFMNPLKFYAYFSGEKVSNVNGRNLVFLANAIKNYRSLNLLAFKQGLLMGLAEVRVVKG